jgi:hypothetical protein
MALANTRRETRRCVATPTQNTIYSAYDPKNATRRDAAKPTPSVATRILATPTQDVTFAYMNLGKPKDTTVANRRQISRLQSSRRRLKI